MTFGGHIVYLWTAYSNTRPSGARVQMLLQGPQINNFIIIITNIQGQIIMKGTINLVKDAVHFASALKLQLISSFESAECFWKVLNSMSM